ncbi:hypothetical protein [Nannocystis pusilla]|uniref:hypothetical protein n=1 Tax=Nannocystis pusilla TaxID=889268 RepID=UPI003B7B013C
MLFSPGSSHVPLPQVFSHCTHVAESSSQVSHSCTTPSPQSSGSTCSSTVNGPTQVRFVAASIAQYCQVSVSVLLPL